MQVARSAARPQARQLAFKAPARSLYFHSRQSIIAAAAEVRAPGRRQGSSRLGSGGDTAHSKA